MNLRGMVAAWGIALALIALPQAPNASAYEFHATLSLTGGCTTSPADPVADPPVDDCSSGAHPPSGSFLKPKGVAVDAYGDIYVASYGKDGSTGRVDVFDPFGFFITELLIPNGPQKIAVDSSGNLYVYELFPQAIENRRISRYPPTVYKPEDGKISYTSEPVLVVDQDGPPAFLPTSSGIAVSPKDDHLFVHYEDRVAEFSSAETGNSLVGSGIGLGVLQFGSGLAIDATHNRVYASDSEPSLKKSRVRVFELEPPHNLVETVDGSNTPEGGFGTQAGQLQLAADEATGGFFVHDSGQNRVFEFDSEYEYVSTITHEFINPTFPAIAVSNASVNQSYLFVTSGFNALGHSYAFAPPEGGPPDIESTSLTGISAREVELQATINPNQIDTHYTVEYVSEESFKAEGFAAATTIDTGDIAASSEAVSVSVGLSNLAPSTAYRFRISAENEKGSDTAEAAFSTYPEEAPAGFCSNGGFRTGPSALLPDCRAYELVSPADTNGLKPGGIGGNGLFFPTLQASPQGNAASFSIGGGTLPGFEGAGAFNGQNYVSTREATGWHTAIIGPKGSESMAPLPGGISPDQEHAFWSTGGGLDEGTAVIAGEETTYIRYPDGHSELIGRGSLDTDSQVDGKLISEDGGHIIFRTLSFGGHKAVQLEENAPGGGTAVIYDRTADEVTHVVSLLPGDEPPADGQDALYRGASYDGVGIAFSIGAKLYLRVNNEETFEVTEGATFAGVAAGGERVFYVKGGDLFAFDSNTEETIPFITSGADVSVVNVSEEGKRAYFISPTILVGEPNPEGDLPKAGQPNLYLSEEGALAFVGTVTERDAKGEPTSGGDYGGLGLWTLGLEFGSPSRDPSRTTPDGDTLLFESRADLTEFESEKFAQVYRYDLSEASLQCLSCNPTGAKPTTDASLQSLGALNPDSPMGGTPRILNVRPDGARVLFQSYEPLVASDVDGLQDVYEWEEQGVGSCKTVGGCTYLISAGQSARDDYLFAVSESGDDVFFLSSDQLLPTDTETTRSLYDARVGGGFAETVINPCPPRIVCWGESTPTPRLSIPASSPRPESGNAVSRKSCPKGKRRVRRHGKVLCVKKKRKNIRTQPRHQGRNR